MSLLVKIKADQLTARKEGDKARASLLTTLIGEASMVGKNDGNRESTDAEVTAVIKKFADKVRETLTVLVQESDQKLVYEHELQILESYLPKQMSEDELRNTVNAIKAEFGVADIKGKGVIMKTLKERHLGAYDGKMAAEIVDSVLKV